MNSDEQPGAVTERTEPTNSSDILVQSSRLSTQSSHNPQRSVELQIRELVLDGFEPTNRHLIGEAIERELMRLFTDQGSPPAITEGGEIARLDARSFEVKPGSNVETIGLQLAKAIYGGFGK